MFYSIKSIHIILLDLISYITISFPDIKIQIISYQVMHLKDNQQLTDKYKKHDWMIKKMNEVSARFDLYQQQVYYATFNEKEKALVHKITEQRIYDIPGSSLTYTHHTYVIIGRKQPFGNNSIQRLLLNLIYFIPVPSTSYSILYINTLASKYAYKDFKKIYEYLPFEYYTHLQRVVVFEASFMDKAAQWISFDPFVTFIRAKTDYASNFQDLIDKIQIQGNKILQILPQKIVNDLKNRDSGLKNVLMKEEQQISIMGAPLMNYVQHNVKNQWLSLSNKAEKPKPKPNMLQNYQVGITGAPLILELLLYYFNDHEDQINIQGLFRKSVDIDQQNKILSELYAHNYNFIEDIKDPHLVANVVKRFLANLISPVIPFDLFNQFMETDDKRLQEVVIKKINQLQLCRKMIVLLLGEFFIDKVLPLQAFNLMNRNNLCIVMGPCLMRSQVPSIKDLMYCRKIITVMGIIIDKFQIIFGDKMKRIKTIRQSMMIIEEYSLKQKLGNLHVQEKEESEFNEFQFSDLLKNMSEPDKMTASSNIPLNSYRIARSHEDFNQGTYNQEDLNITTFKKQTSLLQYSQSQEEVNKDEYKSVRRKEYIPIIELDNNQVIEEEQSIDIPQIIKQVQKQNTYEINQVSQSNNQSRTNFQNYFSYTQPIVFNNSNQKKQAETYPHIEQKIAQKQISQSYDNLEETEHFLSAFSRKK